VHEPSESVRRIERSNRRRVFIGASVGIRKGTAAWILAAEYWNSVGRSQVVGNATDSRQVKKPGEFFEEWDA